LCWRWRRTVLNNAYRPVFWGESFVGNAANISLADLLHTVYFAKQFTPVAEPDLMGCQLGRQSSVVVQATNKIGPQPSLDHFHFFVGYVGGLKALDFCVDCLPQLFGAVAGYRDRVKGKQMRVLSSGKSAEAGRICGDFLVSNQCAKEPRGTAIRHEVSHHIVNCVVRVAIMRAVI